MIADNDNTIQETVEEVEDNVIIFPHFQRINAEELNSDTVTEHYFSQLLKLLEYHGFDTSDDQFVNDMTIVNMLLTASLDRNLGKSNMLHGALDSIMMQLMNASEAVGEN